MNSQREHSQQFECPLGIKNILIPVDMRHPEHSQQAVSTAAWLADVTGSSVHMLTVANPLGDSITEMPERHKPAFEAFVDEMSKESKCQINPVFRSHESVNYVIHDVIASQAIDFVIMWTHHPRLADHLFGSHASQTALHNDCSVLVLRNPAD